MAQLKRTLFAQVLHGARCSAKGLCAGWHAEPALRYELCALPVVLPLGWWLGQEGVERALLLGSAVFVIVIELINSAIESAIDRIGPEPHELSGRAKDLGAAAVFCSIVMAVMVWVLITLRVVH